MLESLQIQHFTAFQSATLEFASGINVIVGDNGTGKTHILKLGYMFCRAWSDLTAKHSGLTRKRAEAYLDDRLTGLFRVPDLGMLVRSGQKSPAQLLARVSGRLPTIRITTAGDSSRASPGLAEPMAWDVRIERNKETSGAVTIVGLPDKAASNAFLPAQLFIPSKEIVSLFKGLIGLFDRYQDFPLDATYRDLAVAMATLEPRASSLLLPDVLQRIQHLVAGDLRLDDGQLVFEKIDGSRLESQLLAEGHRKLAMLIYLLRNNAIELGSTLFWDEPEANLNPAALKLLAEALHVLAGLGVQIVIASHSLFLLREFEILQLATPPEKRPFIRYFGLGAGKRGVSVTQGDDITDIDPLVLLDENLQQSDRYAEAAA